MLKNFEAFVNISIFSAPKSIQKSLENLLITLEIKYLKITLLPT
jgi:hypothetical protein